MKYCHFLKRNKQPQQNQYLYKSFKKHGIQGWTEWMKDTIQKLYFS